MLARALAGVLLCTALAGCSGDPKASGQKDPSGAGDASTSTPTSTSTSPGSASTLPVPEGVEVTEPGTALDVGATATVRYQVRQGIVGVLDIKVTRLEKTSFKESFVGWGLSEETQKAKPYFVRATILNRGESDLGRRPVPLYIVDGANTLVEATSFASSFRPCEPGTFPKSFPAGSTTKVCLVYLAPDKGDLTAVSFRPSQEDAPITWTGELKQPKPPKKDKPGKVKGKDRDQ